MRVCKFPNCTHSSVYNNGCKMHKFPISREKCLLWLQACGYQTTPTKIPNEYYLCSCHFEDSVGPTKFNPYPTKFEETEEDVDEPEENATNKGVLVSILKRKCQPLSGCSRSLTFDVNEMDSNPASVCSIQSGLVEAVDYTDSVQGENVMEQSHISAELCSNHSCSEIIALSSDGENNDECLWKRNHPPSCGSSGNISIVSGDEKVCSTLDDMECISQDWLSSAADGLRSQLDFFGQPPVSNVDEFNDLATAFSPTESPDMKSLSVHGMAPVQVESSFDADNPEAEDNQQTTPAIHIAVSKDKQKSKKRRLFNPEGNCDSDEISREIGIQCSRAPYSYGVCMIHMEDEDFKFYTGVSKKSFNILYTFLGGDEVLPHLKYKFEANTPKRELKTDHTARDKLFITLVRLRRGLPLKDLKLLFHVSETVLSTICYTWIRAMAIKFEKLGKFIFVSSRIQRENPPDCYKPFPDLRCVVDCTEIKIQRPANMEQDANTYSDYKSANTVKVQVATSVYGGLCHISRAAEGSISDRKLMLASGLMDYVKAGEAIMTDKGFDMEAELNRRGINLYIPPHLGNRQHFTPREMLLNKAIATSRVHVERFIKYMKDFKIIKHKIPNNMLDITSDIIRVCANLVMFSEPFIQWNHVVDTDNDTMKSRKKYLRKK